MKRRFLPVAVGIASFALVLCQSGCGGREPGGGDYTSVSKDAPLSVKEVPPDLLEAAKKKLPDVEFTEAWKNVDKAKKLHSYELRGKNAKDGKTREVRIGLDGKVLESE